MENRSDEYVKSLRRLFAALTEMGYSFEDFQCSKKKRIIFQKLTYSLQKCGMIFGYSYNLYINGPYCPSLADDGYFIARNIEFFTSNLNKLKFSEQGKDKIKSALLYLDNSLEDSAWLEIISTMDFISNTYGKQKENKDKVIKRFKEIKPNHADKTVLIEKAWTKISGR